jgi:hypothetical protein
MFSSLLSISSFGNLISIGSLVKGDLVRHDIQKMDAFKLEPAVATSYNIRDIMAAMVAKRIERAQVAGWNNFDKVHVVWWNGTVAPFIPLNPPKYAVFFKKYIDCRVEIVFLTVCDLPCEYKIAPCPVQPVHIQPQQAPCPPRPVHIQPQPIPSPIIRDNNVRIVVDCKKDDVRPCPEFREGERRKRSSRKSSGCKSFPQIRRKSERGPLSSSNLLCRNRASFEFRTDHVLGKDVPVLSIDSSKRIRSKSTVYLINGMKVNISILNYPELLLKIKVFCESCLGSSACLYVNSKSQVFVLKKHILYQVCNLNENLTLKRISSKNRERIESRGLYNVKFNN